jgi:uncharacterized protein YqhQ
VHFVSANEKEIIVGGQAVIEGVMMRTPNAYAVAVRRPDGEITYKAEKVAKWSDAVPLLKLPVLRGAAVLLQSMQLGIKALNYAASQAFGKDEEAAQTSSAQAVGSIIIALAVNALIFIVAPLLITNAIFVGAGWAQPSNQTNAPRVIAQNEIERAASTNEEHANQRANQAAAQSSVSRALTKARELLRPVRPSVAFNLVDGLIRMSFFLLMIFALSRVKDIHRVFEYHGAEHKTVFVWEKNLPLTIENARAQSRLHPRCGTSFLMVVMLVAIALFSVIKFDSLWLNMAARLLLVPVIAGISYEIIRASARREGGIFFKTITRPGLWLQKITTQEPDNAQLEVAIRALEESLKLEPQAQEAVSHTVTPETIAAPIV